jgi:hypothetical protein
MSQSGLTVTILRTDSGYAAKAAVSHSGLVPGSNSLPSPVILWQTKWRA